MEKKFSCFSLCYVCSKTLSFCDIAKNVAIRALRFKTKGAQGTNSQNMYGFISEYILHQR